MRKALNPKLLMITLAMTSLFIISTYAYAADIFDLAYTLTEGGYRLEFDEVNPYKGVELAVDSNVNTRYEVIQAIIRPLENRDKPNEVIRDNFVVRGLRGTNQYGTLHIPTNDIKVRSGELLYTSDTTGHQDIFTLVYGIVNEQDVEPGHYQGQISFTLRPIGSTRLPVVKYLDIFVNIAQREEVKPIIEIIPVTGLSTITLNSIKEEKQTFDVEVKINGSFKNLFTIKQVITEPLLSNEGNRLDYEAINYVVRDVNIGMPVNVVTSFSSNILEVYASKPDGGAPPSFIITYGLGDLSKQKAGRYSSRIQYFLDELGKITSLGALRLEIENERIFDLLITTPDQKGTIEFRNLKSGEVSKKNEVLIEVKTNIGKPYQVTQNVYSNLTDKEGNVISSKYFILKTEGIDTKGTLRLSHKDEVKKGDTVLFISDDKGSSDKFKLIYELNIPEDVKPGGYSTTLSYSLVEI